MDTEELFKQVKNAVTDLYEVLLASYPPPANRISPLNCSISFELLRGGKKIQVTQEKWAFWSWQLGLNLGPKNEAEWLLPKLPKVWSWKSEQEKHPVRYEVVLSEDLLKNVQEVLAPRKEILIQQARIAAERAERKRAATEKAELEKVDTDELFGKVARGIITSYKSNLPRNLDPEENFVVVMHGNKNEIFVEQTGYVYWGYQLGLGADSESLPPENWPRNGEPVCHRVPLSEKILENIEAELLKPKAYKNLVDLFVMGAGGIIPFDEEVDKILGLYSSTDRPSVLTRANRDASAKIKENQSNLISYYQKRLQQNIPS